MKGVFCTCIFSLVTAYGNAQDNSHINDLLKLTYVKTTPPLSGIKNDPDEKFSEKKEQHEDKERDNTHFNSSNFKNEKDAALQKTYSADETHCSKVHILSNWTGPQSGFLRSDNNRSQLSGRQYTRWRNDAR
jgi:hypothetical protein